MTGPEHYQAAEKLLTEHGDNPFAMFDLAAAQVHATLALAAATALMDVDPEAHGLPALDYDHWREIAGTSR